MKFRINRIMRKVLKNPPKGQEIKEFTFRKLTNDILVVLNVKLYSHDIGVLISEKKNTFRTYLISEFEAAKQRVKAAEQRRKEEEIDAKYFSEYLESKGIYLSDYYIKRTVQGYMPFGTRENDLYRDYLCTEFSTKADREFEEWKNERNNGQANKDDNKV